MEELRQSLECPTVFMFKSNSNTYIHLSKTTAKH